MKNQFLHVQKNDYTDLTDRLVWVHNCQGKVCKIYY